LNCDFCDTDFETGTTQTVDEILTTIQSFPCRWIVWTGGEPTLQLTEAIILFFKNAGYWQAIESNGHLPLPGGLDYTVVSPKRQLQGQRAKGEGQRELEYAKKINFQVDEIRLPVKKGDIIPEIASLPKARFYFLSPIFTDNTASTQANIDYCVEQIKQQPEWRLSLQIHKLIGIE
jgi:organic radical activating enzyme